MKKIFDENGNEISLKECIIDYLIHKREEEKIPEDEQFRLVLQYEHRDYIEKDLSLNMIHDNMDFYEMDVLEFIDDI